MLLSTMHLLDLKIRQRVCSSSMALSKKKTLIDLKVYDGGRITDRDKANLEVLNLSG